LSEDGRGSATVNTDVVAYLTVASCPPAPFEAKAREIISGQYGKAKTMTDSTTKPARTLRDHSIKAVIWKNQNDKGAWYSVEFIRSYKDGDDWKESRSFSNGQLLQLSHLAAKAYDAVAKLEAADREKAA
jgi:hypothetical protein